jgi:hypothetical protein
VKKVVLVLDITNNIDSSYIDVAEKEIYEILLNQHLSYSDRWYSSFFFKKIMPILRVFGIFASIVGFTLSIFIILNKPSWCPIWINIETYALIFFLCGLIFYFLPRCHKSVEAWSRKNAYKNCKKVAGKCVEEAKKMAPYTAKYEFKDNMIIYYRIKDDVSKLAWKRKLTGVAYHGEKATVIFRKWTSFIPKIIILNEDIDLLDSILTNASLQTRKSIKG